MIPATIMPFMRRKLIERIVEMNEKKNFVKEFCKTWLSIIKEPKTFFANMPTSGGFKDPLIFITGVTIIGVSVDILIKLAKGSMEFYEILSMLVMPFLTIFIMAGFLQFVIKRFNGSGSFETTFRILAYTSVLHVFPMNNAIIIWVMALWSAILTIIGIEQAHGLSMKKSIGAYISFFVFSMFLFFIGILIAVFIFGKLKH